MTTSPLGMVFPGAERFPASEPWVQEVAARIGMDISQMTMVNLPRHPSQLYEALGEGVLLWLFLWFVGRRLKTFEGALIGMYLCGYGLVRFGIEYFRQPDKGIDFPLLLGGESPNYLRVSLLNFTVGQIFSFLMILAGVVCFLVLKKLDKGQRGLKPLT